MKFSEKILKFIKEITENISSNISSIKSKTDKLTFDTNNRIAIQNPPNLDVLLSSRASETTLSSIKAQTDKLTFDSENRLSIQNPPNLDVALSSRASESTLSNLLNTLKPALKGSLFSQSVTADTNFFASYLIPASHPCTFRIYACFDTSGILSIVKKVGDTEVVMQLNGGNNLSVNCLYAFDIAVDEGEEINFRYSVDAVALDVKVYEIQASVS